MGGAGAYLWEAGDVVTAVNLQQYTQDQVVAVYADSAARDAAYGGAGEPTLAEGMFCFLKNSDTLQYYDGSAWQNFTSGIAETIFDAKGDIIAASAADTAVRVAVGSNNTVLMADSAQAAGLKWASEATATLTTTGDVLYASSANTLARLGIGSSGQALVVSGGIPSWGNVASSGDSDQITIAVQVFS
jgi:hypothetical protein